MLPLGNGDYSWDAKVYVDANGPKKATLEARGGTSSDLRRWEGRIDDTASKSRLGFTAALEQGDKVLLSAIHATEWPRGDAYLQQTIAAPLADHSPAKSMKPRSTSAESELDAQPCDRRRSRLPGAGACPRPAATNARTQVSRSERPVTIASKCWPMRGCSSSAAADLRTPALDLLRGVLLLGAMLGQRLQLGRGVGGRRAGEHRLDHAQRDEVGIAPVRRGRVHVVAHGQAEVADRRFARLLDDVFAASPSA